MKDQIRKSLEDNGFFGALRAFLFDFTTDFFGAFFQYPGKYGSIPNLPELIKI